MVVRVTLDRYLDRHGLSAYRLAKETEGDAARGTIYALARGDVKRLDLTTLATVMAGLERLTGETVRIDDLLERFDPVPEDEDAAWLDSDASGLAGFEAYDWGTMDPTTAGEPIAIPEGSGTPADRD